MNKKNTKTLSYFSSPNQDNAYCNDLSWLQPSPLSTAYNLNKKIWGKTTSVFSPGMWVIHHSAPIHWRSEGWSRRGDNIIWGQSNHHAATTLTTSVTLLTMTISDIILALLLSPPPLSWTTRGDMTTTMVRSVISRRHCGRNDNTGSRTPWTWINFPSSGAFLILPHQRKYLETSWLPHRKLSYDGIMKYLSCVSKDCYLFFNQCFFNMGMCWCFLVNGVNILTFFHCLSA